MPGTRVLLWRQPPCVVRSQYHHHKESCDLCFKRLNCFNSPLMLVPRSCSPQEELQTILYPPNLTGQNSSTDTLSSLLLSPVLSPFPPIPPPFSSTLFIPLLPPIAFLLSDSPTQFQSKVTFRHSEAQLASQDTWPYSITRKSVSFSPKPRVGSQKKSQQQPTTDRCQLRISFFGADDPGQLTGLRGLVSTYSCAGKVRLRGT